ncbi:MAG: cation transporter [Pseudomonas sp.]|uniref:heavy-metal-associated domain-containing protein n=1 Tax=Pseudomonas sp. TaxID=306 RepID=UPI003392644D
MHAVENHLFSVTGMTCGHCIKAITAAVRAKDPAAEVQVDLANGQVQVRSTLPAAALIAAMDAEGYPAQPA